MSSPPTCVSDLTAESVAFTVENSKVSSLQIPLSPRKHTKGVSTSVQSPTRAQRARKKILFEARRAVISGGGLDHHKVLFDRLAAPNMSGDETDHAGEESPTGYRIVESRWQSDDLKAFMRHLDDRYRNYQEQLVADEKLLHTRLAHPGARVEDSFAPRGLWQNCYNPEWLRKLPQYKRCALKVIKSDYDFDLTPVFDELEDAVMQERGSGSADEVEVAL
ncbi:hypothetical protein C8Q70DRAFT_1059733 [Cubamyces menziesii]|nr:hypothetical protein C8Q70DRAFT_1059733 [Cubamyces menziesii]